MLEDALTFREGTLLLVSINTECNKMHGGMLSDAVLLQLQSNIVRDECKISGMTFYCLKVTISVVSFCGDLLSGQI